MLTYEQLLRFYVEQTRRPVQADPRVLSYADLHEYYQAFFDRPVTPLPPALPPATLENTDADVFLTEDEVVTKDEAREAFASVQEGFAAVGEEQGRMKEGLQGLASKIDEVQGKAAEDVRKLAEAGGHCVIADELRRQRLVGPRGRSGTTTGSSASCSSTSVGDWRCRAPGNGDGAA